MKRSLSFIADPPQSYHTFSYHKKKALKEGYLDAQLDPRIQSGIIKHAIAGLANLFKIPTGYHIILLQDEQLLLKSLINLAPAGIALEGSSGFIDQFCKYSHRVTLLDNLNSDLSAEKGRGFTYKDHSIEKKEIMKHKDYSSQKSGKRQDIEQASKVTGKIPLILQDIDPMTGRKTFLNNQKYDLDSEAFSFTHFDISHSCPTDPLNFEKIQSFSFRTKYGFGMSEDLLIWILKDDLFDKVVSLLTGAKMELDLDSLRKIKVLAEPNAKLNHIYVLGMITQDFLNRGVTMIRNEIKYKSIILYNSIVDNPNLKPIVNDPLYRSQNIICAQTDAPQEKLFEFMADNRIEFDVISGSNDSSVIRVGNYPVHSKEQMEYLADLMVKL